MNAHVRFLRRGLDKEGYLGDGVDAAERSGVVHCGLISLTLLPGITCVSRLTSSLRMSEALTGHQPYYYKEGLRA